MDNDQQILAEVLMNEALQYLQRGLLDEAAEIVAVAEAVEMGQDPFCNLANVEDGTNEGS